MPVISTCDHSRSQASDARKPCREIVRTRVASRWALRLVLVALINCSISAAVRYSPRLRRVSLHGRTRLTCRFRCFGFVGCRCGFIGVIRLCWKILSENTQKPISYQCRIHPAGRRDRSHGPHDGKRHLD